MIYLVCKQLSTGYSPGVILEGTDFSPTVLAALINARALKDIGSWQLEKIPGWKLRAAMLAELGITTINDYCYTAPEKIAQTFDRDLDNIVGWKDEIFDWFKKEKKDSN